MKTSNAWMLLLVTCSLCACLSWFARGLMERGKAVQTAGAPAERADGTRAGIKVPWGFVSAKFDQMGETGLQGCILGTNGRPVVVVSMDSGHQSLVRSVRGFTAAGRKTFEAAFHTNDAVKTLAVSLRGRPLHIWVFSETGVMLSRETFAGNGVNAERSLFAPDGTVTAVQHTTRFSD